MTERTLSLDHPANYINRELSWLSFNERVLEEAMDEHQPLLERVKFLHIFDSNLDEFFEIRVAGLKQQIENEEEEQSESDHMAPRELLEQLRSRIDHLVQRQYSLWNTELKPALAEEGIVFVEMKDLNKRELKWVHHYFTEEVYPVLTPLALDPSHPFPQLANKSHNIIVSLRKRSETEDRFFAVVQIPRVLKRVIEIPGELSAHRSRRFLFLKGLIKFSLNDLFPGLTVVEAHGFRITRNSDLYLDEEEVENLLRLVEEELRKRSRGRAVRLEVEASTPKTVVDMLLRHLDLTESDCYRLDGPLSFQHLAPLVFSEEFPELKDRPFVPIYPRDLPSGGDSFEVLRRKDVLVHHPFESFNTVVEFLEQAAHDPAVLAIKLTLYRTSGDSPILHALINAARLGKQVTALMEIKARFDEANNINWGRKLEEAGVHVVYGMVGLKTHSKLLLIVRRDTDRIRHYAHIGTGNYHPSTAKIYTDLGLFTTNPEITGEVAAIFNKLTGLSEFQAFQHLLVAPYNMADRFLELIRRESAHAQAGKPGKIIVKINSLVDPTMIRALYEASCAGVDIEMVVRGICCLRPGVPGVSERIRVISIVGRFLEHSRIFWFSNGGQPEVFIGSADWMPRNLYRRIEVITPLKDQALCKRVTEEILPAYLNDCVKARELQSDGSYRRLTPPEGMPPQQAQMTFRELARRASRAGCELEH